MAELDRVSVRRSPRMGNLSCFALFAFPTHGTGFQRSV